MGTAMRRWARRGAWFVAVDALVAVVGLSVAHAAVDDLIPGGGTSAVPTVASHRAPSLLIVAARSGAAGAGIAALGEVGPDRRRHLRRVGLRPAPRRGIESAETSLLVSTYSTGVSASDAEAFVRLAAAEVCCSRPQPARTSSGSRTDARR